MPEDASWRERHAARAVLFDKDGRVALLYAAKQGYYKLPGGGVEENEDIQAALARELLEEVGAQARVIGEMGRVEEWRVLTEGNLHQISDAYEAEVIGDVGEPDFTEGEIAEGFRVEWVDTVNRAIELVENALNHSDPRVRSMAMRDSAILRSGKNRGEV